MAISCWRVSTSGLGGKRSKVDCIRPQHLEWFPGGEEWGNVPFAAIRASITTVLNHHCQSLAAASVLHFSRGRVPRGENASIALRYGRGFPIFSTKALAFLRTFYWQRSGQ